MSSYQAIVFDMDGTAIPNEPGGMPSSRLLATVAKYRDRIHLITATGRPLRYALPIIEALGLTNLCIVSGGTVIVDPLTQQILKTTPLPAQAVHAIFNAVRNRPYALTLREERVDTTVPTLHPSLAENVEIIFIGLIPGTEVNDFAAILSQIPNISASVVPDWSDSNSFAFNITHSNATKEHAVADVLAQLGVPQAAAIGIGDADNDLHLFRSVGLKIAMGNASEALKAAADEIAPTVNDDGLAVIIERYAGTLKNTF